MHIHILGICGTFMGGIAALAQQSGYKVTGCDANVYPPMSTQLEAKGIQLIEGYTAEQTKLNPDIYVIGNAVSRGNPLMEEILNQGLPYISGPQWLAEHVLQGKWGTRCCWDAWQNNYFIYVSLDIRIRRFSTRVFNWWRA